MRIHIFQHAPFEGPGMISSWAAAAGHSIETTFFFNEKTVIPPLDNYDMLVIMGGPMSVHDEVEYQWLNSEKAHLRAAIAAGKIVLGICLGAQMIASALGARVYTNPVKEIGWFPVAIEDLAISHPFLADLNPAMNVFHWHGETFDLPEGALHLMSSAACRHQAFLYGGRVLGMQFHLEMDAEGIRQIITHCQHDLAPGEYVQSAAVIEEKIINIVACEHVLTKLLNRLCAGT